ncbi:hypothetical protein BDY17DRAFT_300034 [Neohortaea acidophila]|uniref:Uncharacterized protein n=1 Tax=Neohortaea acidophila TaxID=245834 RepID=A0A6A6PRX9_9PEZI|nr:uncharacterized protein BDY17DRAFT_300034 [Neohortaea acidophila]KAF2481977.1 hypothetical protein BDY17DRAFT_300034 [Neohortaea acidophila]
MASVRQSPKALAHGVDGAAGTQRAVPHPVPRLGRRLVLRLEALVDGTPVEGPRREALVRPHGGSAGAPTTTACLALRSTMAATTDIITDTMATTATSTTVEARATLTARLEALPATPTVPRAALPATPMVPRAALPATPTAHLEALPATLTAHPAATAPPADTHGGGPHLTRARRGCTPTLPSTRRPPTTTRTRDGTQHTPLTPPKPSSPTATASLPATAVTRRRLDTLDGRETADKILRATLTGALGGNWWTDNQSLLAPRLDLFLSPRAGAHLSLAFP